MKRMRMYGKYRPDLVVQAVEALNLKGFGNVTTHVIVAFLHNLLSWAPTRLLRNGPAFNVTSQRTLVEFMGCSAPVPALRFAQQAVLADPAGCVLVVNLELFTLHLQETLDLETALSFQLFGDGCSGAIVSRHEVGIVLHDFRSAPIPDTEDLITWHVANQGSTWICPEMYQA
jgi:predicted naringenin-chalcone synthase